MAWYDRIVNFFSPQEEVSEEPDEEVVEAPKKAPRPAEVITKTRLTRDTDDPIGRGITTIVSPTEDADWKLKSFTEEALATKDFAEILDILVDAAPDLDRALSDMQMQVVTHPDISFEGEGPAVAAAEEIIQNALDTMTYLRKESLRTKIKRMVASGYLKGALFVEVVFTDGVFEDIRVIDPLRARFKQDENPQRGQFWQLGQEVNGLFEPLDSDNVFYVPLNPVEDKPYGRSMVGTAIFPMVYLLGLMKDGRQVIKTQAWPTQVALIDRQKFIEAAGEDNVEIYEELEGLVTRLQERLAADFQSAKQGSQHVYGNEVSFEQLGQMGRSNLSAMEMIKDILKEWIIQALKQYPATFGIQKGNALSTNADQQLELFTTFIGTFQSEIEEVINSCFTRILTEAGNPAVPIFQLERDNSLVDKQRAERIRIKTETLDMWLASGVITRQEYRNMIRLPDAFDAIEKVLEEELPEELSELPMPGEPEPTPEEPVSEPEDDDNE